ncbi:MAG TPA: HEAT repeat domain-containing protein, partial [Legionellaceae bacterium]|nr:HEAT repeat domain-containing protein [Legionellaceae bacterium]
MFNFFKGKSSASSARTPIEECIIHLSSPKTGERREALDALGNLAHNRENRISIAQAGAIAPLVKLLSDSDTVVRQNAAAALYNLALNSENQISIAQAGAIAPLVKLL